MHKSNSASGPPRLMNAWRVYSMRAQIAMATKLYLYCTASHPSEQTHTDKNTAPSISSCREFGNFVIQEMLKVALVEIKRRLSSPIFKSTSFSLPLSLLSISTRITTEERHAVSWVRQAQTHKFIAASGHKRTTKRAKRAL